jgi:hypothetical protein
MTDAIAQINAAAAEAGRSIDDDHFGTTLFVAPSPAEMPPAAARLLELRPELDPADHIAFGAKALRALIERFVEAGAQKFVVVPIADDVSGWLDELWEDAVAPVQAMPVPG